MLGLKQILLFSFLITSRIYVSGQTAPSDSLAYEMAKSQFLIDTSFTGFKLSNIFENNYIYTPNGLADKYREEETSGFVIMVLPIMGYEKGAEFIKSTHLYNNYTVINSCFVDTVVNGNRILEHTFEIKPEPHKVYYIYQAFLLTGTKTFIFMGKDIDEGKCISSIKRTFRNIIF
ncbi:MAG: hypothetical protein ACTHMM_13770 [Agriterribacter sp.]